MTEYRFANGTTVVVGPNWCSATLPRGLRVEAHPNADSPRMAEQLGYGCDVAAMTRDHDLLHAWLADALGLPQSFSLAQTAGLEVPPDLAGIEEDAVLAVQRFVQVCRSRHLLPERLFGA